MSKPHVQIRIAKTGEWAFQKGKCQICSGTETGDMLVVLEQVFEDHKVMLSKLCVYCAKDIAIKTMDCLALRIFEPRD